MNAQTGAIVRALVGMIVEARTAAADRIFPNRWHPVWEEQLPAVLVHTTDEEVTIRDTAPRVYERHLRLALTIFVEAETAVAGNPPRRVSSDPKLDELGQQLEEVLAFDRTLLGTCADCRIIETHVSPVETSNRDMSAGRMVLDVQYFTEADEGGDVRALFDLEHVRLVWGPKPPEGQQPAGFVQDLDLPPPDPS